MRPYLPKPMWGASVEDRFWSKVDPFGPVPAHKPNLGPCWLWTDKPNSEGYAALRVGGRSGSTLKGHRIAYELVVGFIPKGLALDHLCSVRHCVNPAHLEPVTAVENTKRGRSGQFQKAKTHCPQGHPYDEENTYVSPEGRRACRECKRGYDRGIRLRVPA